MLCGPCASGRRVAQKGDRYLKVPDSGRGYVNRRAVRCVSRFAGLPDTCYLTAMPTERELLEQIADVLARRNETRFDPAIRSDGRNATDQSQRLDDAVAQVHFEHALLAHLRQRCRALPDTAKRIESDCGRLRSWVTRCQQLPDHVEQQIDLHVETDDVLSRSCIVVRLLVRPVLFQGGYRLQDSQVSFGITTDQCGIEGLLQTMPRDRQYIFVCQFLVQDDRVEPFVHDSNRAGAASSLLAAPDQIHHEIDVTCTGIFTAIADCGRSVLRLTGQLTCGRRNARRDGFDRSHLSDRRV